MSKNITKLFDTDHNECHNNRHNNNNERNEDEDAIDQKV